MTFDCVCYSKVQARFAFATYLSRVQQRLMTETSTSETEDGESANEQMVSTTKFISANNIKNVLYLYKLFTVMDTSSP